VCNQSVREDENDIRFINKLNYKLNKYSYLSRFQCRIRRPHVSVSATRLTVRATKEDFESSEELLEERVGNFL
jgi:hypothetical protein